jgi:hypothetical protein
MEAGERGIWADFFVSGTGAEMTDDGIVFA